MSKKNAPVLGRPAKKAFTIVELLVVIAIIGVLVSMLLPAVNAVRDAARRTQNENNLKQVGTAIISYEAQHGTYPPMIKPSRIDPQDITKSVSWAFEILPFLEQDVVHNKFNAEDSCLATTNNIVAMTSPVETFANPRRRDARAVSPFSSDQYSKMSAGTLVLGSSLDYAGNGGVIVDDDRNPVALPSDRTRVSGVYPFDQRFDPKYSGPFHPKLAVPSAAVKDGLSNTLGVGDRWIEPAALVALGRAIGQGSPPDSISRVDQAGMAGDSFYATVRFGNVDDNFRMPLPSGKDDPSIFKFGGPKGSEACFAYLDGHVRWIPYDVNPNIFMFLSAINDGNPIPANF